MKLSIRFATIIVCAGAVAMGAFAQAGTAQQILEQYFEYLETAQETEAYALLTQSERETALLDDYKEVVEGQISLSELLENALVESESFHRFIVRYLMTHEILSSTRDGTDVVFEVEVSYLDFFVVAMD